MSSAIGEVQAAALDVADGLEALDADLSAHAERLEQVSQSIETVLGDSHQEDVSALQDAVRQSIEAVGGCSESVRQAAQETRDAESRT